MVGCLEAHYESDPNHPCKIRVDSATGIIYGGTPAQAGTWMDKCAENPERTPSTPRDGAAIEIQALAYEVLSWASKSERFKVFESGVWLTKSFRNIISHDSDTIESWAEKLGNNFHDKYYVPLTHPKSRRLKSGFYKVINLKKNKND